MEELREAVQALAADVQKVEREMGAMGDVPSRGQLAVLQQDVDRIQRGLNRMQTAMDTWMEETEQV